MGRGHSKAMRRYKAYKARKAHKKTRVVFGDIDIMKNTEANLVPEKGQGLEDFQRSR